MPRAPDVEERLLPGGSTQRATRPGRARETDGHAPVLASLMFVLLAVVRSTFVVRAEYGMGTSVRYPHSAIQVAAPVLRFLITAPLLAVAYFVERRVMVAASLAALNQRITSREPVFVPPGPCAVPWVGIFFLALVDMNATVGLSVATRASAAADAAFSAFSTGCITVPITIGLSRLLLGCTFRRSQLAAAALSAGGIALGVIPQLYNLAVGADVTGKHSVGSPAAVAASVFTAIGMVGLPLAFAIVYREALLARPSPQQPAIALIRFGLSLVAWEGLFSAVLQAAMLVLTHARDPVRLATLPAYFVNSTRCLVAVSMNQGEEPSGDGGTCGGIGLAFVVLAGTEAATRMAAYTTIRNSSSSTFSVVSTLVWPAAQVVTAWPLALGRAASSPGWEFCGHGNDKPDCVTPLGPFDVASLGTCIVAVVIWCNSIRLQGQGSESAEACAFSQSSSSQHAVAVSDNDDRDAAEDSGTFDDVVLEVIGLHRKGVYMLVILIVLMLVICVSVIVAWVTEVVHAIGCLIQASHDFCNRRELLQSCVIALVPIVLLGSALLLRWQLNRLGKWRRQEACKAVGAVQATLHVYDWSGANVPLITKFNDWVPAFGLYHTGVEFDGKEYAYGFNDTGTTGVYSLDPMAAADVFGHRHRVALPLGAFVVPLAERRVMMAELERVWLGDRYDLLSRNCNHFSEKLCEGLGLGAERPGYTNRLAGVGYTLIGAARFLQKYV